MGSMACAGKGMFFGCFESRVWGKHLPRRVRDSRIANLDLGCHALNMCNILRRREKEQQPHKLLSTINSRIAIRESRIEDHKFAYWPAVISQKDTQPKLETQQLVVPYSNSLLPYNHRFEPIPNSLSCWHSPCLYPIEIKNPAS